MGGDDQDPALVPVGQVFDLALTKVIAESGPFFPGDVVTYEITVYNQGTLDADSIVITETPPVGMTNVDSDWTGNTFTVGNLAAGTSTTVDVDLKIGDTFQGTSLVNNAEITEASNVLDIEDEDGAISIVDGGVAGDESELDTDNDIDDDGAGTPGTADNMDDVDDYDPAQIDVVQTFDLALTKVINTNQTPEPFAPGDQVQFNITVINQGTLDAYDVDIVDNAPTGLSDPTLLGGGAIGATQNAPGDFSIAFIPAGASRTIRVRSFIDADFQGASLVNDAEITLSLIHI